MPPEDGNNKYLMLLPSHARLFGSDCEMEDTRSYLMDKDNIIYFYSAELQVAVESLNSYTCDSTGKEISFSYMNARRTRILACEDALTELTG